MGKMFRVQLSMMQIAHSGIVPEAEKTHSRPTVEDEGVTIYRLPPEEVERLLKSQYGDKLEAVNTNATGKQKQRNTRQPSYHW